MGNAHPSLTFDLVSLTTRERLEKSLKAAMIAEATTGRGNDSGLFSAIRRAFGGALIGVGQKVHGGQDGAASESPLPAANTLGLAR